MEILRDHEVPQPRAEHREGALLHLLFGALLTIIGLGVLLLPVFVPDARAVFALVPLIVIAGSVLSMARVGLGSYLASRHPNAWLVRRAGDHAYLRFRSFLNWRFDPDTPTVVRLDAAEIDWVRPLVRDARERDGDARWTSALRASHLEIAPADPASLAFLRDALRQEGERRDGRGARANHRPLGISPGGTLLLETSRPEEVCALFSDLARVRERLRMEARAFERMSWDERLAHANEPPGSGRAVSAAARVPATGSSLE